MGQVDSQPQLTTGPCHLAQLPAELLTREVYRHLDPVSQACVGMTAWWAQRLHGTTKVPPLTRRVALSQGAARHVRRFTSAPYKSREYDVGWIGVNMGIMTLDEMLDICKLTVVVTDETATGTIVLFGVFIEFARDDFIAEWCVRSPSLMGHRSIRQNLVYCRVWFTAYLNRTAALSTLSPYLWPLVALTRDINWVPHWLACVTTERSARRSIQLAAESKDVAKAIKRAFRLVDPRNVKDVNPWAYAVARAWSTPSTGVTRCVPRPRPVDILTLFTDPAELAAWFDMAGPGVLTNQEMLFALDMTPKALERGLLRVLRERGGLDYNAIPLLTLVQSFVRLEATFPLWVADLRATPPERMTPKLHQLLVICDVLAEGK